MNQLNGNIALITGGSRGFGRSIVEALVGEGATVHTLARNAEHLDQLRREIQGVQTCVADVTDPDLAPRVLREIQPDILVLNAGATPPLLPIYEQTWDQFSRVWETDVKSTFYFGKEALLMPMKPGSVVIIVSSGAGIAGGTQVLGGFPGAKRTQWFMAQYFQEAANSKNLGIRFVALLPRLSDQTEMGHASISTFAAREGISIEAYLERSGVPMTPEKVGQSVVNLLTDETYQEGLAFGFSDKAVLKALS